MGPLCCGSERAAPDPALNTFPFFGMSATREFKK